MSFRSLWSELEGDIPRLPAAKAQDCINQAWHDLCDTRLWTWLNKVSYITTPANISTGTMTVTLGSTSITVSAAAATAFNALGFSDPPLASTQLGIGRQIRLSSQTSGTPGALYNITAFDGVTTLTIDRPYAEESASSQNFMCYKAYYQPPPSNGTTLADFLRYFTVTNSAVGYTIRLKRLHLTQERLNAWDPQRGSTGDPYFLCYLQDDPETGAPVYEFWPHPVSLRVLTCNYQLRGLDRSDALDIPLTCPSYVLTERAKQYACQWALKNVAVFSELQQTNWVAAYQQHESQYNRLLIQAIKQDDEKQPLVPFSQYKSDMMPPGGAWLQNHDVAAWFSSNG